MRTTKSIIKQMERWQAKYKEAKRETIKAESYLNKCEEREVAILNKIDLLFEDLCDAEAEEAVARGD